MAKNSRARYLTEPLTQSDAPDNEWTSLVDLATATAAYLSKKKFDNDDDSRLGANFAQTLFEIAESRMHPRYPGERPVRGLRFAPQVLGRQVANDDLSELHRAAVAAFPLVRWSEFYAEDEWSQSFLPNFANGEGVGPDGRIYHESVILGLFLLGPDTTYPAHAHPAEEFYIVLQGDAEFQVGAGQDFRSFRPGSVILHHENVSHSIRTSAETLFAVFGWRGAINERSWFRDDMIDTSLPVRHPTIAKS